MSKKSIVIISLISIFTLVVFCFTSCADNSFDTTAGNSAWAKYYYESFEDKYADVGEMPPQSSPQDYTYIDVVTPISKYFVYENANGYGTISSRMDWDTVKDLRIQVEDIYLQASDYGRDNAFLVVKDNKGIGRVEFEFSKNENLKKGDKIIVYPKFYQYDSEESFEYFFDEVEIEVPDLGEYFTASRSFTNETLESLKMLLNTSKKIRFVYYGEIKPGEINNYNSPGFLLVVSHSGSYYYVSIYHDVIVNEDGSIRSYSEFGTPQSALPYCLGPTKNLVEVYDYLGLVRKYYAIMLICEY